MHTYVGVCIYAYMFVFRQTHICVHTYMNIYTHVFMYAYVYMYIDMHGHIFWVYMYINTCILDRHMYVPYMYMYVYMLYECERIHNQLTVSILSYK